MRRRLRIALGLCLAGLAALVGCRGSMLLKAAPYALEPKHVAPPLAGLRPRDVVSTWGAPRSGGRRHQGVDLFARRGTEIRSATRGEVWRVGTDRLGGRVVTVLGDGPALYYYAHLDDWAEGLRVGSPVQPGTPLGTVGNTGNARTTPPHLHFGVYRIGLLRNRAVDPAAFLIRRAEFPAASPRRPRSGPQGAGR